MRTCGKFHQSASDIFCLSHPRIRKFKAKEKGRPARRPDPKTERVNNLMNHLITITHKEQRVLTTQQLAEAYETDSKTISNNFTRNKSRYEEDKHFFVIQGEDLKEFKSSHQIDDQFKQSAKLYLWTEKGALLHAKSLGTDKAWEVYDLLVETYFRAQVMAAIMTDEQKLQLAVFSATTREAAAFASAELDRFRKHQIQHLETKIEADRPAVEFFNTAVDRNGLTNIRDTAYEIGCRQTDLVNVMLAKRWIYRSTKSRIKPHAEFTPNGKGFLEYKDFEAKNGFASGQTMFTVKGKTAILEIMKKEGYITTTEVSVCQ